MHCAQLTIQARIMKLNVEHATVFYFLESEYMKQMRGCPYWFARLLYEGSINVFVHSTIKKSYKHGISAHCLFSQNSVHYLHADIK